MKISGISGTAQTSSESARTTWTYRQVTQLKNLVSQGLPLNLIAQRLNCSAADVKLEAEALKLNLNTK